MSSRKISPMTDAIPDLPPAMPDAFLAADPVMARLVEIIGPCQLSPQNRGFQGLARAIVAQQLSTKAAMTIMDRVLQLAGQPLLPENVLALPDEALRTAGLSYRKIAYLKDLAAKVACDDINFDRLQTLTDEAVIRQLTSVKGIGLWTAEMYLIFDLHRPDVFSWGDLALAKAICDLYDIHPEDYTTAARIIVDQWRPHRSAACWYLWASRDEEYRHKINAAEKA